jgi:hypothetical protein
MKFVEALSHGSFKINRGMYNPFLKINGLHVLALHTGAYEMFYNVFHLKLIKPFPYDHSCDSFSTMPHHGHIMLLLHDLHA